MNSMTGYGKAALEKDWARISVWFRTLNSRYLDFYVSIPFMKTSDEE